jgi:NDP-sugar pyrophosphorylase family protein
MKAMIFAAGVGSRLGAITRSTPKCLVDVDGQPVLGTVIERLKEAGVDSLIINLHHLPDQVQAYIHENESFGLSIEFSLEKELLDTGGGLKKVSDFFAGEQAFLIHNADIYSEIDLKGLVKTHIESSAAATLAVREADDARRLLFDQSLQLCGWENRDTNKRKLVVEREDLKALGFCGVSVGSVQLLDAMGGKPDRFSLIEPFLDLSAAGSAVLGAIQTAPWIDIGTPEDLEKVRGSKHQ